MLTSRRIKGSHILSVLRAAPSISNIDILARRSPPSSETDTKLTTFLESDTSKWASQFKSLKSAPQIYFCAFATTRANAGGFENQYKIEHDLNIELAKEAKEAGTKVFVLISSSGASKDSRIPYSRLKGDIEEDVKALDFEHTVILRPGLIGGKREESRPAEAVIRQIAAFAGSISNKLKDFWAQDADVIAKAAVSAGLQSLDGKAPGKVWLLGGADIVRLGVMEWEG